MSLSNIRESDPTPDKGTDKFIKGICAQLSERESDMEDCNRGCGASNHLFSRGNLKRWGHGAQFYSTHVPKRVTLLRKPMTADDERISFTNTEVCP